MKRLLPFLVSLLPFTAFSQFPPSQRSLNGFLLGQHEAVLRPLGTPFQEGKDDNGWRYKAFIIDKERASYMLFMFPDTTHEKNFHTIQLTGGSGTKMTSFLGLKLGDPRELVLSRIGNPSRTRQIEEPEVELLVFEGRNYTLELDPSGKIYSIRLSGSEGFNENPAVSYSLDSIFAILSTKDPKSILGLLAPDVEVFQGDSVISFHGGAETEIHDPTSPIWRALVTSDTSFLSVLTDSTLRASGESSLRIFETKRMALVHKFPIPFPLEEIVFVNDYGNFRI